MSRRVRTTIVLLGLLVGSMAVGAIATALSSSKSRQPASNSQASSSSLAPSATMQATFGLLRRQVTPSDSMASFVAQVPPVSSASWQSRIGVDLAQARRANIAGHTLWLAAGPANACVFAKRSGSGGVFSCGPGMVFATEGSASTLMNADGSVTVLGVLPDGVHAARLVLSSQQSLPVSISDNAFWVTVKSDPVALDFTRNNGQPETLKLYTSH